jgi:hypothetical protein
MAINLPNWADLGLDHLSDTIKYAWDYELMEIERYRYYYDGLVFDEKVEVEGQIEGEAPLMFPVGLNLVQMLCLAQADAAFGEYEDQPVYFAVGKDHMADDSDNRAIELANLIVEGSDGASLFWEGELERNVFGGSAFKITPDFKARGKIRWSRVPRDQFFPIWDPGDPNVLLEAYVVTPMTAEQAAAKYGYTNPNNLDIVYYVEHWTRTAYESSINHEYRLNDYSGINPWGVVPFVYTPRYRLHTWWGESLSKEIIPVQDELNMRIADVGDAINYNAHPTRYGFNLPRDFNAKNYPLGPNSMWNLGRQIGSSPPPEVGILEAKSAVANGVFDHIQFLYDWARTSSSAPPIAFGEDNGGGQRSGVTLEIRMWPLVKAIRRSRAYLRASLKRALYISGAILKQKDFDGIPKRAIDRFLDGTIVPRFYEVLPRDHSAIVDEVVKLLATDPPAISLETALVILGRGANEQKRIVDMLQNSALWDNARTKAQQPAPGQEGDQGEQQEAQPKSDD